MKIVAMQKVMPWVTTTLILVALSVPQAQAYSVYHDDRYTNPPGTSVGRYFRQHPIAKKAIIGIGAGALLGGLVGGRNWKNAAIKGAFMGGLAGTAFGYAQSQGYLGGLPPASPYAYSGYYPSQNASYVQPAYHLD